ncbi:pectin acetylesterase-family hydrolase [Nannocystis pusilla]|uniref:Pectin acetylesterase-family hydrolase n=1 Tax=Nannocystis pusilla TaxID=889268 RepID=A0A9X3EUG7_9BACT|nr:pectin acetylesterase-family hydrolase [Nannocystis pusilla]MCY1009510.1 pectin acetylesterase-family hydrolase [Nannocystis pusilla]
MADSSRILLTSSLLLSMQVMACSEPVAGSEGEPTPSGTSTGDTDDTTTTTGDAPTGTSGVTTGPGEATATTTGGTSTTGEDVMPEPEVWDGEKLPWEEFGRWSWVPFPDSQCRDGSSTGIWLRYGKGPGLAIFFEGGGACFNALTCANNDASFDHTWAFGWDGMGLFDAEWTDNPIHDWNIVYVPYCTGDVHAGNRTDVEVPGVEGVQKFVGYRNVTAYLDRIVPTFEAAPNVLVTGVSAGGFGAGIHYDRIARAFPDARVTLLDDSGPPLANDVLAPCLQQQWNDLWGLEDALPADCDDCFPSAGGGLVNLARYLGEKHPKQHLGLVSSTQDVTIRFFFGYGEDECMPKTINVPAGEFEAGLVDLRDHYVAEPAGVWSTYFVGGSGDHVWTVGTPFSNTYVQGVRFVDWFADLLAGEAGHVGP